MVNYFTLKSPSNILSEVTCFCYLSSGVHHTSTFTKNRKLSLSHSRIIDVNHRPGIVKSLLCISSSSHHYTMLDQMILAVQRLLNCRSEAYKCLYIGVLVKKNELFFYNQE